MNIVFTYDHMYLELYDELQNKNKHKYYHRYVINILKPRWRFLCNRIGRRRIVWSCNITQLSFLGSRASTNRCILILILPLIMSIIYLLNEPKSFFCVVWPFKLYCVKRVSGDTSNIVTDQRSNLTTVHAKQLLFCQLNF